MARPMSTGTTYLEWCTDLLDRTHDRLSLGGWQSPLKQFNSFPQLPPTSVRTSSLDFTSANRSSLRTVRNIFTWVVIHLHCH